MIVLQASKISKFFGGEKILDNTSLSLQTGEKAGLVGYNGAGKTTLLRILAGQIPSDSGEIYKPAGMSLGYLSQKNQLDSETTVLDEMYTVNKKLIDQEYYLGDLEKKMGSPEIAENKAAFQQISQEYADLLEEFRSNGGYEFHANTRAILYGLGFSEEYFQQKINTLSGGQKTRLALGKLLAANNDVLLLDEPTNHLDLETLTWLEKYLAGYPGAVLTVSHDRYFLDTLVQNIYEIDESQLIKYNGNYSSFIQQKLENNKLQLKNYKRQQSEIQRSEDFIQRNIARASTTGRAQSRKKALEKIEILKKPSDFKSVNFSFNIERSSGHEVFKTSDLAIGYPQLILSEKINIEIHKGDRVALVGANGTGKTTFLKTLIGLIQPLNGHMTLGTNVTIGYYDQEQTELKGSITVLDQLWSKYPHLNEKTIRDILGSFLFSGDDVEKTLDQLSGGERAKLALSQIILSLSNFLVLDEPTNHLDVYSREVLEDALLDYDGTILFISHDRYFLNKLSSKIFELSSQGIFDFSGNYQNYLDTKKSILNPANPKDISPAKELARQNYQQEKDNQRLKEKMGRKLVEIEAAIEATEKEISVLEEEIFLPEIYQNLELLLTKNNALENQKHILTDLYISWEKIIEENS
ncbi:MAG: ABC-F family ATP-binding cassette domain-containing protein [Peptococcaceae bacterium]|nr:ABC-F family ATP-binding cassette domain-containing protein [Peptococcaceae bacterium]